MAHEHAHHHHAATASPAPSAPPSDAVEYTCPMHPEVVQLGPGSCPKCGMALEPRVVALKAEAADDPELVDMRRRLRLSTALTIPVFALAMGEMIPGLAAIATSRASVWLQLVLATPVVLWGGLPFFQRGWASIVHRSLNMFTLIALGTAVAYGYSVVATIAPQLVATATHGSHGGVPVYFEAASVITTLVLLGQVLELRARSQTSDALRSLLRLQPKTARRMTDCGHERDVDLALVVPGDRLRVRPGETI